MLCKRYIVMQNLMSFTDNVKDDFSVHPVFCNYRKDMGSVKCRFLSRLFFLSTIYVSPESVFKTRKAAEKHMHERIDKERKRRGHR